MGHQNAHLAILDIIYQVTHVTKINVVAQTETVLPEQAVLRMELLIVHLATPVITYQVEVAIKIKAVVLLLLMRLVRMTL